MGRARRETFPISQIGAHTALLTVFCDECSTAFTTVSRSARFCSNRCKLAHWKADRRRSALVDAFMEFFEVAGSERARLLGIVKRFERAFARLARWLGFCYQSKKYRWTMRTR